MPDDYPDTPRDRMPVSIDFHNNDVNNVHDNCFEADGGMHNVRIFENRCFNCHNPDKAKGGLHLTTYGNAMAGGSSGEIITPGNANDSRLFKSVAHLEDPKMPPKGDKLPKPESD